MHGALGARSALVPQRRRPLVAASLDLLNRSRHSVTNAWCVAADGP